MSLSYFKKPALSAIIFFGTLGILSVSYSAYSGLSAVTSSDKLTVGIWNQVKDNFDELNSRTSALVSSGGNVGIGTGTIGFSWPLSISKGATGDATAWLSIQGSRTTPNSAFGWIIGYYGETPVGWIQFVTGTAGSDSGHIYFNTKASWAANSTQLVIRDTGNVGIGTTNPQTKLDVNGPIRFIRSDPAPFACDTTKLGAFYLDSDAGGNDELCVCNYRGGVSAWRTAAHAACD